MADRMAAKDSKKAGVKARAPARNARTTRTASRPASTARPTRITRNTHPRDDNRVNKMSSRPIDSVTGLPFRTNRVQANRMQKATDAMLSQAEEGGYKPRSMGPPPPPNYQHVPGVYRDSARTPLPSVPEHQQLTQAELAAYDAQFQGPNLYGAPPNPNNFMYPPPPGGAPSVSASLTTAPPSSGGRSTGGFSTPPRSPEPPSQDPNGHKAPSASLKKTKLKGKIYRGMDCFDAAYERERRQRNQKKSPSVTRRLRRMSGMIQRVEKCYSPTITGSWRLKKSRSIYAPTSSPSAHSTPAKNENLNGNGRHTRDPLGRLDKPYFGKGQLGGRKSYNTRVDNKVEEEVVLHRRTRRTHVYVDSAASYCDEEEDFESPLGNAPSPAADVYENVYTTAPPSYNAASNAASRGYNAEPRHRQRVNVYHEQHCVGNLDHLANAAASSIPASADDERNAAIHGRFSNIQTAAGLDNYGMPNIGRYGNGYGFLPNDNYQIAFGNAGMTNPAQGGYDAPPAYQAQNHQQYGAGPSRVGGSSISQYNAGASHNRNYSTGQGYANDLATMFTTNHSQWGPGPVGNGYGGASYGGSMSANMFDQQPVGRLTSNTSDMNARRYQDANMFTQQAMGPTQAPASAQAAASAHVAESMSGLGLSDNFNTDMQMDAPVASVEDAEDAEDAKDAQEQSSQSDEDRTVTAPATPF
ncbi:hypothetical protein EJ08DRAFT_393595 [Tothia fuscella]|uniref:Uncharacterized protein n=1 Tax=Tothia fuscella TaxID=1048955 RepID=A0A9P4P0T6_9PEZI|nr:hypothetical protein EJ08DRAFT_393595 [Tothia fuscella]